MKNSLIVRAEKIREYFSKSAPVNCKNKKYLKKTTETI